MRLLAGLPLIAHTIGQARLARGVDRVIVSTDDPEIGDLSGQYGAEVVWRPLELSGDSASSESALLYTLDHLRRTEGTEPDLLTFLQCTSPLTLAEDIDGTLQALLAAGADSALAVTPFHYFLWQPTEDGGAIGINHDKRVRPLRQEREPQYRETGAIYVMRTPGFRQARHRFFGKTAFYVIPPERCFEIDDPVDFQVAEVLMREQLWAHRLGCLPDPVRALVMDFDGIFTDNRVFVGQDGRESVVCSRSDGWGLARLRDAGIPMLVLSTEQNPIVQARCDKLGLACRQGLDDKLRVLEAWLDAKGIPRSGVVYVGNDINDLACLSAVGCGVVVADAHPSVVGAARLQLSSQGGRGALREIADLILQPIIRGS